MSADGESNPQQGSKSPMKIKSPTRLTHRAARSRQMLPLVMLASLLLAAFLTLPHSASAQAPATPPSTQTPDTGGPTVDNGPIVIPKKKESEEPPAPVAPEQPKVKNPGGETFSIRAVRSTVSRISCFSGGVTSI